MTLTRSCCEQNPRTKPKGIELGSANPSPCRRLAFADGRSLQGQFGLAPGLSVVTGLFVLSLVPRHAFLYRNVRTKRTMRTKSPGCNGVSLRKGRNGGGGSLF
jgi:hypothetical protein